MNGSGFNIQKLRVASPCYVGWETMSGDERKRLCSQCGINVYNIQGMTPHEVRGLVQNRKDRPCIRLYRRADGTVVTKDCPVGLRAYQKRVAKFAGALFTLILGLFSVSFGQKQDADNTENVKIVRAQNLNRENNLKGLITDTNGAIIPDVTIRIFKEEAKKYFLKTATNKNGEFQFACLPPGKYRLETTYRNDIFKKLVKNIEIRPNENVEIQIALEVSGETIEVGIFAEEPMIDTGSSSITTTITREMIDKITN